MKLFLPLLMVALSQPGNDPQKLLNALEEKIATASSVQITFAAQMESSKSKGSAKGTLTFTPKGKVRANLDMDGDGKQFKVFLVSDGIKLATSENGKPTKVAAMPEFLPKAMIALAAKTGIFSGMMFGISRGEAGGKQTDPFADLKQGDFKLGKVEKIDGKDTQIVEYQLTLGGPAVQMDAKVWIDVKTTLPVKRQLVANIGGERVTLTETYSEFRLNANLDAKVFDLPK